MFRVTRSLCSQLELQWKKFKAIVRSSGTPPMSFQNRFRFCASSPLVGTQRICMSLLTHSWVGRLQKLKLWEAPLPTLPKFLSSANSQVDLHLEKITRTRYTSPDTMVTCPSMLKRLRRSFPGFLPQSNKPTSASSDTRSLSRTRQLRVQKLQRVLGGPHIPN